MLFKERKQSFTLIELLVVIAIIGILSSIILPSLSKARAKTIAAVCLNNQKQIKLASIIYADDNDEWLLRSSNDQSRTWPAILHDNGLLTVPNSESKTNGGLYHRDQESNSFIIWCPAETSHHPIADIGMNSSLSLASKW